MCIRDSKADCITEKGQELPCVFLDDFGDARISLLPDSGCFRAQERMRRYLHRMDAVSYTHLDVYKRQEHLLIGLRQVYTGVAGQVLDANGVEEEKILKVMEELVSPVGNVSLAHRPEVSPRLAYILEDSKAEAMRFRSEEIGTEHLLMALLRDVDCVACRILLTLNINMQKVYQEILEVLGVDPTEYQEELAQEAGRRDGVLEQFGTDLTAQAEEGKLDPVIGRDVYKRQSIHRLMAFCRWTVLSPSL